MKPVRMENGQGLVEYALLMVFIAIVVILILSIFGTTVGQVFSNTVGSL